MAKTEHLQMTRGEQTLETVNLYRRAIEEEFRVEPLNTEFPYFAHLLGHQGVFLACAGDNLAGAFKWRGATVGAHELKKRGHASIVVPSAGNHARGAVLAAKEQDLAVNVVVPTTAPHAKREGLRELWNDPKFRLYMVGETFDESLEFALAHPELGALLHPFDDPNVAAGQGTLVDDILAEIDPQHIVLPVGGGGLLAGVLNRLQELKRTDILVHAAEAEGSNGLSKSLAAHELVSADRPNARYGGSAVRRIGHHTLAVCRNSANWKIVPVLDSDVEYLTDLYEQDRTDLLREDTPNYEPTSLVAIAGSAQVAGEHPNEKIVVIGTGHNDVLRPKTPPRHTSLVARGFIL